MVSKTEQEQSEEYWGPYWKPYSDYLFQRRVLSLFFSAKLRENIKGIENLPISSSTH